MMATCGHKRLFIVPSWQRHPVLTLRAMGAPRGAQDSVSPTHWARGLDTAVLLGVLLVQMEASDLRPAELPSRGQGTCDV